MNEAALKEQVALIRNAKWVGCGVCLGHSPSWDGHDRGCHRGFTLDLLNMIDPECTCKGEPARWEHHVRCPKGKADFAALADWEKELMAAEAVRVTPTGQAEVVNEPGPDAMSSAAARKGARFRLALSDPGSFVPRRFDVGPDRDETEPLIDWQIRAIAEWLRHSADGSEGYSNSDILDLADYIETGSV